MSLSKKKIDNKLKNNNPPRMAKIRIENPPITNNALGNKMTMMNPIIIIANKCLKVNFTSFQRKNEAMIPIIIWVKCEESMFISLPINV